MKYPPTLELTLLKYKSNCIKRNGFILKCSLKCMPGGQMQFVKKKCKCVNYINMLQSVETVKNSTDTCWSSHYFFASHKSHFTTLRNIQFAGQIFLSLSAMQYELYDFTVSSFYFRSKVIWCNLSNNVFILITFHLIKFLNFQIQK